MDSIQIDNPCEELKGAADAVSLSLQWIDKGFSLEKVGDLTQQYRITICEDCPNFDAKDRRCLECCCLMDFKTSLKYDPFKSVPFFKKTVIECPLKKW